MKWMRPEIIERGHDMMWIRGIWSVLIVGLLVVGAVLVARTFAARSGHNGTPSTSGRPLQILEERFARGEIDEEEFKQRRDLLRS
jgi:putative membrane protein